MKLPKKTFLALTAFLIIAALWSCGDWSLETGGIPKSSLSIPGALTADSGSRSISRGATSTGGTAENFFEPFRTSLELAEEILIFVNEMIDSLNESIVPDNFDDMIGDQYVIISTDTNREYAKRIDFRSSESAEKPFLQINYTTGIVKGEIYYIEEDSTLDLESIKVFYDETGSQPVLRGWITIKEMTTDDTYPKSVYFNATKNSAGQIIVDGGLAYHFVFGDSSNINWPDYYVAEHTYMYKALASSDGTKAEVALYFPLSTVSTTTIPESMNIKNSFLDILFEWIETDNPGDLDTILGQTPETITGGSSLGTVLDGLGGTADDDLDFVLKLSNNIAYSDVSGYMGNEGNTTYPFPSAYNLGDPTTITFTMSPAGIAGLTAADLAPLTD